MMHEIREVIAEWLHSHDWGSLEYQLFSADDLVIVLKDAGYVVVPVETTGKGRRYPLNMRTTKEIRENMEKAAAKSGRSLAGEVEHIIECHFSKRR